MYCSRCGTKFDRSICPNCKNELLNVSTYIFPSLSLLKHGEKNWGDSEEQIRHTAIILQRTLQNFHVCATVTNVNCGPSITQYELQVEQGVRTRSVINLVDEIKVNLAAPSIRIEAAIPSRTTIGIEIPNIKKTVITLRDLLETKEFQYYYSEVAFAIGRNITGRVIISDMRKLSPLLITGISKSEKSVCINTLIMSILYKARPDEVKLIMIDPKVVELSVYNGIPHLMLPVVTDPKKSAGALNWAVVEMEKRCQLFAKYRVRDLNGYNDKVELIKGVEDKTKPEKLPQIVIIVNGLEDLMMLLPTEIEYALYHLSRLGRTTGIYVIISTNDISSDTITKSIYLSVSSRISFKTTSKTSRKTIINIQEEKELLNNGDMLFYPFVDHAPMRIQGAFISTKEVQSVIEFLSKSNDNFQYNNTSHSFKNNKSNEKDAYFIDAGKFIINKNKASIGMLQRIFKIGFNRAERIMEQLEEVGVVGEKKGIKPRKVLMTLEEFESSFKTII